jgi:hypothetical protein
MKNSGHLLTIMAEKSLSLYPPIIRDSILDDDEFLQEIGLQVDGSAHIRKLGITVRRSDLYEAFRAVDTGSPNVRLTDRSGVEWEVTKDGGESEWPAIRLSNGGQQERIPNLFALSAEPGVRIRCLEEVSSDAFLEPSTVQKWRAVLEERPANEPELERLLEDLRSTPGSVEREILRESKAGRGTLETLLPRSRSYFERLVGSYDGSGSINDYATGAWKTHCRETFEWQPFEGFLQNLYLSGHAALVGEIRTEGLGSEDLEKAFGFLVTSADWLSKLGGIEIGLRILPDHPELEPVVRQLIEQIRDEDTAAGDSGFVVLSNLLVLVDGLLSSRGTFRNEPPFYRRMISLAHSALVHRQFIKANIDLEAIVEWSKQFGSLQFHCQSLTDMRLAPRWIPGFASPEQLKAEFFGRIINATKLVEKSIRETSIYDIVLGETADSLLAGSSSPLPFLPGPLEGDRNSARQAPREFQEAVDEQLDSEGVSASSFVALVNSSLLFDVEKRHADLAAEILKLGNQRIERLRNRKELMDILSGLGSAAAVSCSEALQEQVQILTRRYRRDSEFQITIGDAVCVRLMASAAKVDYADWCKAVGNCMTDLAFDELTPSESAELLAYLETMLQISPALWNSCGRAHAALRAIVDS